MSFVSLSDGFVVVDWDSWTESRSFSDLANVI